MTRPAEVRERIAATQRRRWEERREQATRLTALEAAHRRVLDLLIMGQAALQQCAQEHADASLARFVCDELERAWTDLALENLEAREFLGSAGHRADNVALTERSGAT